MKVLDGIEDNSSDSESEEAKDLNYQENNNLKN